MAAEGGIGRWRRTAGHRPVLPERRAFTGEEPVEVFAHIWNPQADSRYASVEETIAFMLRFPSGAIANCAASYGAHESKDIGVRLERGWIDLENAFAYRGQRIRIAQRHGAGQRTAPWRG